MTRKNDYAVRGIVDYYARTTGLRGVPLLVYTVLRVRGRTWAGVVTDETLPPALVLPDAP